VRRYGVPNPCRPTEAQDPLDVEGWLYQTSYGSQCIALHRPGGVGDFLLTPVNARQVRSARPLMTSDATTLPATLLATGWSGW